ERLRRRVRGAGGRRRARRRAADDAAMGTADGVRPGSRRKSDRARAGSRTMKARVALFDVDGVILRGKGLNLFARSLVACGEAKPALAMRGAWYALGHRLGWLDGGAVLRRVAAAYLTGRRVAEFASHG